MLVATLILAAQAADLHPAFELDPEIMVKEYRAGREYAKKKGKIDRLAREFSLDIGRTRSPDGWSFTAPYATLLTPYAVAKLRGFEDQRSYDDEKPFLDEMAELKERPIPPADRRLRLGVALYAWPGVNTFNNAINRRADPDDVRRVKFVLLIDGDKALKPVVEPDKISESDLSGGVTIPEYNTVYGQSRTDSTATATGTGGSATVIGRSKSSSTVTYVTHRVDEFSAYEASYLLEFPLFDENGKPYITKNTKKITIKAIRENGEHSGTFDLGRYVPKR